MGDRVTFAFQQEDNDIIYLYGHWAGYDMMHNLACAIEKARPRWQDEGYATRIAISQLIGNEWDQEYSWGITTYFCDSEHSIPVVNWKEQTVDLIPMSWLDQFDRNAEPKFVMGFEPFIKRFTKTLTAA